MKTKKKYRNEKNQWVKRRKIAIRDNKRRKLQGYT